jgi:hypothetical protein
MNKKTETSSDTQAFGIIITCGSQPRVEPKLSMYVWCGEAEGDTDTTTKAA